MNSFSVLKLWHTHASSKVKVNENLNQRALFNRKYWDIARFSCDFITFHCFVMWLSTGQISAGFGWANWAGFSLVLASGKFEHIFILIIMNNFFERLFVINIVRGAISFIILNTSVIRINKFPWWIINSLHFNKRLSKLSYTQ